ncbi:uncharacterized protein LOC115575136 [Sparus aurata]|uniref:uncharacterized protein LOC115575136 n=1 Tax=Sparus aurata TaxID=8175 RepID=UPI0011C112ED|nr:uncharacterized protein LOC115575136 [Sparus aurata]
MAGPLAASVAVWQAPWLLAVVANHSPSSSVVWSCMERECGPGFVDFHPHGFKPLVPGTVPGVDQVNGGPRIHQGSAWVPLRSQFRQSPCARPSLPSRICGVFEGTMSSEQQTDTPSPYVLPVDHLVQFILLHCLYSCPPIILSPSVYTGGGGGSGGLDSTEGKRKYVSYETPLGSSPGMTTCTSCQQQVMTNVTYKAGTYAWLMCLLFICCGLACGCFLIPLFVKHFKDAYHTCPRCNRILHVEKKKCCK